MEGYSDKWRILSWDSAIGNTLRCRLLLEQAQSRAGCFALQGGENRLIVNVYISTKLHGVTTRHRVTFIVCAAGVCSFALKTRCSALPSVELSANIDENKMWRNCYQQYQYYQQRPACRHDFKDREKFSDFKSQMWLEENVLSVLVLLQIV